MKSEKENDILEKSNYEPPKEILIDSYKLIFNQKLAKDNYFYRC